MEFMSWTGFWLEGCEQLLLYFPLCSALICAVCCCFFILLVKQACILSELREEPVQAVHRCTHKWQRRKKSFEDEIQKSFLVCDRYEMYTSPSLCQFPICTQRANVQLSQRSRGGSRVLMISKIGFGVKINTTRDMQGSLLAHELSQTDGSWVSTKRI